ncbi:hypothetical protein Pyrfu_0075 [Pyrolobus fumarii 1A]|uniref:Uncharacterized protein n=1 Tax=Pyrolobus fumarii (strain DSM 11204 / 1A) TaxID=694429 RepID=G0EE31_PYRF1|nr:hypothetical protein [Pyrolobus fumarii]AEM37947.1 hypothetical protein Pyrfu_0075 [Pyrolobus fumarii 1A]
MHILAGILVAAVVYIAALLAGIEGAALPLAAILAGFLASGIVYIVKLLANLTGEVRAEKAYELSEWLNEAVRALGMPVRRVSLVFSTRGREGFHLVQIPEAKGVDIHLLESLLLSSASRGEPLAHMVQRGTLAVIMAGRIAAHLAEAIERRRGKPLARIRDTEQLKNIYKMLRAIYQSVTNAPRAVAAYMAVKALGRLIGQGLLSFQDWSIAENALRYLPAEPPWIKIRVKRQLANETEIQP